LSKNTLSDLFFIEKDGRVYTDIIRGTHILPSDVPFLEEELNKYHTIDMPHYRLIFCHPTDRIDISRWSYKEDLLNDNNITDGLMYAIAISYPRTATAVIIKNKADEVLFASNKGGLIANMWNIPGGFLEGYETHTDAIRREIMEELGIDLSGHELRYITSVQHSFNRTRLPFVNSVIYYVELDNPLIRIDPIEINAHMWMDPRAMLQPQTELSINPITIKALEEYLQDE